MYVHEPLYRIAQVAARFALTEAWSHTLLLACAPGTRDDISTVTNRPRSEIAWLPPVVSADRILALAKSGIARMSHQGVLIGACGTADKRKGVDLWLEIVERVMSEAGDSDLHFIWIGGEEPPLFDAWSTRTKLGERVTFTGSLENPYEWMASLDMFTLTSRADQFPLVVLEAMNLGLPVVGFDVGGVRDQVAEAGWLVPVGDCEAAARAVLHLVRQPEVRARYGRLAKQRAGEMFAIRDFDRAVVRYAVEAVERARACSS